MEAMIMFIEILIFDDSEQIHDLRLSEVFKVVKKQMKGEIRLSDYESANEKFEENFR